VADRRGELRKIVQIGNLRFDGRAVGVRERFFAPVILPFLGGFIQGFVLRLKLIFEGFSRLLFLKFCAQPIRDRFKRPG